MYLKLSVPVYLLLIEHHALSQRYAVTLQALVSNSDNPTCRTCTSIPRLLALSMSALSKVISTCVNDNSSSQNGVLANELDVAIANGALCVARAISLEVS